MLTNELLADVKIYDAIRDRGFQGPVLAKAAVAVIIKMIFEDGFFHADPHPGNILILGEPDQPVIGLIDLGMVGRLSTTAYDLPQQTREILDDLRLGRLTLQTANPALPALVDRLGRRLFSGLLVASLLLSGTALVIAGSRSEDLGIVMLALASVASDVLRRFFKR